ncbi:hypothetical protein HWV62_4461 [Athelia sp. TMB]|nr:hypothetical protein HWV62_4461 [Athelia sp. TMB]
MFHYYQYTSGDALSVPHDASLQAGRAINPRPVLSVLLEPCSAIVTTSSLYTSHLHGIEEIGEDVVRINEDGEPTVAGLEVSVANWHLLTGAPARALHPGGALKRGTRYSLTCRDVTKVMSAKSFLRR